MKLLDKKDALTVFSDMPLQNLKHLLEIGSAPIIVMENQMNIIGVLDECLFWKHIKNDDKNQDIDAFLNKSFFIVKSLKDITEEDLQTYDFVIQKRDHHYRCYPMSEIKYVKLQMKMNSLLNMNKSLHDELEASRKENKELKQILNSSYDEIYVTDSEGNTLFVSESCKKLTGLPPEAFIGKNIKELTEKGIVINSVTLRTMKTKSVHSAEQIYPNGLTVLATSKPIFDEKGNLYRVVTNSRDISELVKMKKQLNKVQSKNKAALAPKKVFYYKNLITSSEPMLSVIDLAKKVAPMDSSIFIHGESGVGKGALAKIIHELSPRKNNNFVQVNCGAIPSSLIESELFGYESGAFTGATKGGKIGLVEMANGGTLFLDEIGEMPMDMQVKLLHLVQEKKFMKVGGTKEKTVDIRIISATNKNLTQMISEKKFREDLYYRLHVVPLRIPPLHERKEDVITLIDYFLYRFNKKYGQSVSLDESSKMLLQLHDYPGNVRELENLIEQIVVTASNNVISAKDLPLDVNKIRIPAESDKKEIMPLKQAIEVTEKQLLTYALTKYKSTRQLAKILDVSQTTVMRKLNKYHLSTSY